MAVQSHKKDLNSEKGIGGRRVHKEEATFDDELQRYIMPSERAFLLKRKNVK